MLVWGGRVARGVGGGGRGGRGEGGRGGGGGGGGRQTAQIHWRRRNFLGADVWVRGLRGGE